jgi:hypothetical protein
MSENIPTAIPANLASNVDARAQNAPVIAQPMQNGQDIGEFTFNLALKLV